MPRRAAILLAVALAASACNTSKRAPQDDALNQDGGGTTTTTVGQNGSGPGTTLGSGTPTTVRKGTASTTTTNMFSNRPPVTNGERQTGNRGNVGAYARSLLRPQPFNRIIVEVLRQADAAPQQRSLDHLAESLRSASSKEIVVSAPTTIPGGAKGYTAEEIRAMADQHAKNKESSLTGVLNFLFLKGTYNNDENVLGIAVRGDTVAIFVDQVRAAASPIAPRAIIEDAVTQHELGHLLGLVDLVLPTHRGDPGHPGHSRNDQSVMFWAVESGLIGQAIEGPPPVDFDSDDRADFGAMRNGA